MKVNRENSKNHQIDCIKKNMLISSKKQTSKSLISKDSFIGLHGGLDLKNSGIDITVLMYNKQFNFNINSKQ